MSARWESSFSARVHRAWTDVAGTLLGFVSPARACGFYRARRNLYDIKRRGYEAGQPGGANKNWNPVNRSADADIRRFGPRVKARARDLVNNDCRVAGAVGTYVRNVVRTGIWPQAAFTRRNGKPDAARNKACEALWHSWAKVAQASGRGSLYALQRLALRHQFGDGEIILRAVWNRKFSILPLRFELIETDQLDTAVDGQLKDGHLAARGVEFAPDGSVAALHILRYHPGDGGILDLGKSGMGSERVPAEDCKLVFRRDRASQTRGISWLAAVALRAFNLSEYDDYELLGAKLAAAFGVFVASPFPEGQSPFAEGASMPSAPPLPEFIEPGMIKRLSMGEKIEIAEHNRPGNNYADFVTANKQDQAAGLEMSYETYSRDGRRSSFSMARQFSLEDRMQFRCVQDWLCEELMDWIWGRFLLACSLSGKLDLPGFAQEPERYLSAVVWQTPGWTWIDPVKDAKAAETRIDLGISSRTREAREQGADFEESVREQIAEEELLLELARKRAERSALEAKAARPATEPTPATAQSPAEEAPDAQP